MITSLSHKLINCEHGNLSEQDSSVQIPKFFVLLTSEFYSFDVANICSA